MAETLAEAIARDIAVSGWPVDERLGSEQELIQRHSVSRGVFREALRILERDGVAFMRRGPNGGLYVCAPQPGTAVKAMTHYLDYVGVSVHELYDARRSLELRGIELAAARLDAVGIERLRTHLALEAQADATDGDLVEEAHEFHRLIAELSGNPALMLFIQCASDLAEKFSRREPRSVVEPALAHDVHQAHTAIAEALIAGDAAVARHHLSRHLDAITARVSSPEPVVYLPPKTGTDLKARRQRHVHETTTQARV
jgi:DNA-binding FadR family transcriptional regulator